MVRTGARAEAMGAALADAGCDVATRGPPAPRIDVLPADLCAAVVALHREFAFEDRIRRLDAAVAASGRADGPERNVLLFTITPTAQETDTSWLPEGLLERSPFALIGSPTDMVAKLHERRARWGLSYFACFRQHAEHLIPVIDELRRETADM